jgi:hypothetical protein
MKPLFPFEIPRRSTHCSQQGEKLFPGMEVYSTLLEDNGQISRRDFCPSCWLNSQQKGEIKSSYWKSIIEVKEVRQSSHSIYQKAWNLLYELQKDPQKEAELFVLCIFLAHARQLILRQEFSTAEGMYQIYEKRKEEEYITVKKFFLSEKQILEIQKNVSEKLK